jgi:thymidine kinase
MLMPQYVNSKTVNVDVEKIKFIPDQSYELDDNQKDVLAQINKRCYLKAAAGSGKTILLLAKAYEVASANPDKLFMIICYNSKLREDIEIQAANTGKIRANLKINTLDKFILDNFSQYDDETTDNKFEIRRKIFVEKVRSGQFAQKYGGIFIDEMQQLNEEYIAAFLELLDENKYMVLAGDYYQQISPGSGYYDSEYKQCLPNFWVTNPDINRSFRIRVGGGEAIIDGIQVSFEPQNITLVTNDSSSSLYISVPQNNFPRADILILKNNGDLEYKMGTEGSSTPPIFPPYGLVIAEFIYNNSTDLGNEGFYGNVIKNIYTNNYISNGSYVGTSQTDEHTLYI